jgi:hypothetical protein
MSMIQSGVSRLTISDTQNDPSGNQDDNEEDDDEYLDLNDDDDDDTNDSTYIFEDTTTSVSDVREGENPIKRTSDEILVLQVIVELLNRLYSLTMINPRHSMQYQTKPSSELR